MRRGQTLTVVLVTPATTTNPGVARDADSAPSVVVRKNGSAAGVTELPTIANVGTGRYKIQLLFTEADWVDGDAYCLEVAWTMESISGFVQTVAQGMVCVDPFLTGTVDDVGASTTAFIAGAGLSADDDEYEKSYVAFTSGDNTGLARPVSSYTGLTRTFTFAADQAWPQAPADGDTFYIIGRR